MKCELSYPCPHCGKDVTFVLNSPVPLPIDLLKFRVEPSPKIQKVKLKVGKRTLTYEIEGNEKEAS